MNLRDRLLSLCLKGLKDKNLHGNLVYTKRLSSEIREIDNQDFHEYYLSTYQKFQQENLQFPYNETNSLIGYLLGLASDFDINKPFVCTYGDFPDIDVDYPKEVKDYIKNDWAPKRFGEEYVSSICSYGALGIKQALLDMARVHDLDVHEVNAITKTIDDKDEDGKPITWEKVLEQYPEVKKYCDNHPEVGEAVSMVIGRAKSRGVHAGGLIISSIPISDVVPMEMTDKGIIISAWGEGLRTQDLSPVGFVKYDVLGVATVYQIALAAKLVKERHNLDSFCASPGNKDWSDTFYLNDPKAIVMANKADLKCIFQFDGEGIRSLVKKSGISRFDDLVAIASLYRPGSVEQADAFCKRRKNKDSYKIHPSLKPILEKTYGIMIYQEQVLQILNVVGEIPKKDCVIVQKAISKKQIGKFGKYKDEFIEKGQINLEKSKQELEKLWSDIEKHAGYSFNLAHATAYTYTSSRQLYLKAHYPLEFYTASLMEEKDFNKIKEIKMDAKRHDIQVMPVHLNYSKENFTIRDEKIYYGFQKLKGIGDDIATKIIQGQPYSSFRDFLDRFGMDAKVIKPLIALGIFEKDGDRITNYKFYEHYKNFTKKQRDKVKRYLRGLEDQINELKQMLPEEYHHTADFTEENRKKWEELFSKDMIPVIRKIKGERKQSEISRYELLLRILWKREKLIRNREAKLIEYEEDNPIDNAFKPDQIEIDPEIEKLYMSDYEEAQAMYYGFYWLHPLERSKLFDGNYIEDVLSGGDVFYSELKTLNKKGKYVAPIDVMVLKVEKKESKNGNRYYQVLVEDAYSKSIKVTFWEDDYLRFERELYKGSLVRMQVIPSVQGYRSFTFDSPPKHEKHKLPKDKKDDLRLIILPAGNNDINQEIEEELIYDE